jgi:hypothetical protein
MRIRAGTHRAGHSGPHGSFRTHPVRVSLRLINSTVTDFDPALSACPRCHYPSDQPQFWVRACLGVSVSQPGFNFVWWTRLVCVHARAL